MRKRTYHIFILVFIVLLTSCKTGNKFSDNPVYWKHRSSFKTIQPGFHLLGSKDGVYRLKYVGEHNSSIESAKEIWLKRAKSYCINSGNIQLSNDQKIIERNTIKYRPIGTNANNSLVDTIVDTFCVQGGFTGCLVATIFRPNLKSKSDTIKVRESSKSNHPEVKGEIDCNLKEI